MRHSIGRIALFSIAVGKAGRVESAGYNPTEPLAHDKALTLIKELRPLTVQEGVIHAFHAMGGCPRRPH